MLALAIPFMRSVRGGIASHVRRKIADFREFLIPLICAVEIIIPVLMTKSSTDTGLFNAILLGTALLVLAMVLYAWFFYTAPSLKLAPVLSYRRRHWLLMLAVMVTFYYEAYWIFATRILPASGIDVYSLRYALMLVGTMAAFCLFPVFRASAAPRR